MTKTMLSTTVRRSGQVAICRSIVILAGLVLLGGCSNGANSSGVTGSGSPAAPDFSTPEQAILNIENAYRAKDVEAAVACKDFKIEAQVMLEKLRMPKDQIDAQMIDKTAEVLELAFRKEMREEGFPEMKGVQSTFPAKEQAGADRVIVTEVCKYPDGGTSRQKILVAKTEKGWRVLIPVE